MIKVVFIAPPLAGKGTLSSMLKTRNDYMHLSVGDLVRSLANKDLKLKEKMDKGELISNEVINNLVKSYFNYNKIIFDGYPRTINQAEFLIDNVDIKTLKVIYLNVDKEILLKRVLGRRQCDKCGRIYNIYVDNVSDSCPICGGNLYQRSDDNEESFENRYHQYLKETYPLIKFFKDNGVLIEIVPPEKRNDLYNVVLKILGEA